MTRRIFVDLESTGDGSNINNSFVELSARYYEDEELKSWFHTHYGHSPKTVYNGGINYKKAAENSKLGYVSADAGVTDFTDWLDSNLEDKRAFFISYNCNWDYTLIKHWFKRNKIKKKYFYDTCICVMALCACKFDKFINLRSCSEALGIEVDSEKLHTADYDVTLAVDVHERLITQLKSVT